MSYRLLFYAHCIFMCVVSHCSFIFSFCEDFPAYVALLGNNVALPCNVTPFTPDDSVSLILWYRNDSIKPLYTVDARDISLDRASHSIDDSLQSRVVFHINYPLGYLKISPVQERDATEYRQVAIFKWGYHGKNWNHILSHNSYVHQSLFVWFDIVSHESTLR